jgi:hypothetical protein
MVPGELGIEIGVIFQSTNTLSRARQPNLPFFDFLFIYLFSLIGGCYAYPGRRIKNKNKTMFAEFLTLMRSVQAGLNYVPHIFFIFFFPMRPDDGVGGGGTMTINPGRRGRCRVTGAGGAAPFKLVSEQLVIVRNHHLANRRHENVFSHLLAFSAD